MTLTKFINDSKGLLIAPAGFGKTYTIAQCIKESPNNGIELILTHTHAGIASLKQKLQSLNVPSSKYQIATITGFAQELVSAFYGISKINGDPQESEFFEKIVHLCAEIISKSAIKRIIKFSYIGLYVDEYQDCNLTQHQLIMNLATILPTRLLGDSLQGIYDFNGERINFDTNLSEYTKYNFLDTPWRWRENGNANLGEKISKIRSYLLKGNRSFKIYDDPHNGFRVIKTDSTNLAAYYNQIRSTINNIKSNSILILIPTYHNKQGLIKGTIHDRADFRKRTKLNYRYDLIEAFDDKAFYSVSRDADKLNESIIRARKQIKKIFEFLNSLTFNKTDLRNWINDKQDKVIIKNKELRKTSMNLKLLFKNYIDHPESKYLLQIIDFFAQQYVKNISRPELFYSIRRCIKLSAENNKSVYQNMCDYKNLKRIKGRNINGYYIGNTLLTKGLEFETVVIIDTHNIPDIRNFYVAISRASNEVILMTDSYDITLRD